MRPAHFRDLGFLPCCMVIMPRYNMLYYNLVTFSTENFENRNVGYQPPLFLSYGSSASWSVTGPHGPHSVPGSCSTLPGSEWAWGFVCLLYFKPQSRQFFEHALDLSWQGYMLIHYYVSFYSYHNMLSKWFLRYNILILIVEPCRHEGRLLRVMFLDMLVF